MPACGDLSRLLLQKPASGGAAAEETPQEQASVVKRAEIRAILNSDRFLDLPPRQIWATLLDEGNYVCHWRTMYRILHEYQEIRERINQRIHPTYTKPELLACGPNQLWTWDITTLRGPKKGMYYKL